MGRGARRLGMMVGVLAACAGVGLGARALVTRARERAAAQAWADLRGCLIGPPLAPGETAADRMERITLALGRLPTGASPEAEWPTRCTPQAQRAADASSLRILAPGVEDPARRLAAELEGWEPATAARGHAPQRATIAAATVEDLLAAGARLEGLAQPARDVVLPPLGARPVVSFADVERAFALDHPQAIREHASLAGRPGAIALLVGKDDCVATPASPAFLCAPPPLAPAYAWRDASGAWVEAHTRPSVMGADGRTLDELPVTASNTYALGPGALWVEGGRVRAVLEEGGRFGRPKDLGPSEHLVDVRVCTRRRGAVVAIGRIAPIADAKPDPLDAVRVTFWFVDGAKWSDAVEAPLLTRVHESRTATVVHSGGRWTLTCDDDEARLAWVEATLADGAEHDEHVVHVLRCTPASCSLDSAPVGALDVPRLFYGMNTTPDADALHVGVAVASRERVVLAWESGRAVWGRVAPLHALAAQPAIPLATWRGADVLGVEDDPSPREMDGAVLLLLWARRRDTDPAAASTSAFVAVRASERGFETVPLR